jgi:UPF0716 protein FxsA
MRILLAIFFTVPLVEMYVLIKVGEQIGALPTIALVVLTAVIGVALLRQQGLSTLTRGVSKLQSGAVPAREMLEGLLLAVGGALLLTPGFVTDAAGFLLLIPWSRQAVASYVLERWAGSLGVDVRVGGIGPERDGEDVIEGDYTRRD